uniref:Uncharacterized protein n=1 Tax=Anopheles arabiensis TaxID=7173 RepID=A0A182IFC3_ANOAR
MRLRLIVFLIAICIVATLGVFKCASLLILGHSFVLRTLGEALLAFHPPCFLICPLLRPILIYVTCLPNISLVYLSILVLACLTRPLM